jgi:aminoglycoside phosphotransferase family enzyme
VTETHSAEVCFVGDRAYKVKKPVDLGFLDFRRRTDREQVCHREVELNRRLAPDVYLGVADVLAAVEAPWPSAHAVDTSGEPGDGLEAALQAIHRV